MALTVLAAVHPERAARKVDWLVSPRMPTNSADDSDDQGSSCCELDCSNPGPYVNGTHAQLGVDVFTDPAAAIGEVCRKDKPDRLL